MPRSHKLLDTMELPPVHRRIFRMILRAQYISYDELCIEAADLPDGLTATPEMINNALSDMINSGLVQAAETATGKVFRISLGQNSDSAPGTSSTQGEAPGSIWDQLDNPSTRRV